MMIEEIAGIVAYMTQAWPHASIGEHTTEVWADACHGVTGQTAQTAIRRIARADDYPPSVARFLAECRIVDKEHANRNALPADSTRLEDCARNTGMFAYLRDAWHAASEGRPEHDHRNGDDNCPCCSTSSEFVANNQQEIMDALRHAWNDAA